MLGIMSFGCAHAKPPAPPEIHSSCVEMVRVLSDDLTGRILRVDTVDVCLRGQRPPPLPQRGT